MIKKKNSFFTFIFSLAPGCGQMYMGFMKEGLSLLSAFAFIIFLGSWLRISPTLYLLPIIWFYSFFDSINKMSLTHEEFYNLKDKYLFELDKLPSLSPTLFSKNKLIIAFLFIFIGLTILWNNTVDFLYILMPDELSYLLRNITYRIPQIIFSLVIIFIGLKLIAGKKEELKKGDIKDEGAQLILEDTKEAENN